MAPGSAGIDLHDWRSRWHAQWSRLATLVHILNEADALRASGELSALDHETVWRRVYDRLGPGRPEPADHQPSI
jgi:hypothetical protein